MPAEQASTVRIWVAIAAMALLTTACGGTPAASGGAPLSIPALKLDVLSAVGGRLEYCDPDLYPVAHGRPLSNAKERLPTIRQDQSTFKAILQHEHIAPGRPLTNAELIAINEDYKQIQAIDLAPSGDGYEATLYVPDKSDPAGNKSVSVTVSRAGAVQLQPPRSGKPIVCPICLAEDVRIDTPAGPVAVQSLRIGMPVWTTDRRGRRIRGVVLEAGHMPAPLGHEVVRLRLADGRTVTASPGHPTADGRRIGDLGPGDRLDGSLVTGAALLPYRTGATYDLLPSGPTGTYFANGVLLESTIPVRRRFLMAPGRGP